MLFKECTCRKEQGSKKWLSHQMSNSIPFDLADIDFAHPTALVEALKLYLDTMVFGYTEPTDGYYDAIIGWFSRRHGLTLERSWILPSPGALPGIANALHAFTKEEDSVMISTPVYHRFFDVIQKTGRTLVTAPLVYEGGQYTIDFKHFESQLIDNNVKVYILCSPHNPIGRVWTRDELETIASLCEKHDVLIVSDELHCDFIMPGHHHIPLISLNDSVKSRVITCISTSKSFNLAGLKSANIIIPNDQLRKIFIDASERLFMGNLDVNAMGLKSTEIAYNTCEPWLDELILHVNSNHQFVKTFMEAHLPMLKLTPLEGTYLQWIDFSECSTHCDKLPTFLETECELFLDDGRRYGAEGKCFMRMNLAYPLSDIEDAMHRLKAALESTSNH